MDTPSELFVSVHFLLLWAFIGTTSMLALLTVVNRLRIRDVLVWWPRGRLKGLPLWPTLFLLAILGLWVQGMLRDQLPYTTFLAGYAFGGLFWFIADAVKSTLLVTPHGLVLNVNRSEECVAWGQIVDYFEFEHGRNLGLVFFYLDGCGSRRRLELRIPEARRDHFDAIARERLAGRFRYESQELAGRQAMEE